MAKIGIDSKIQNDQYVVTEARNLLKLIAEVDAAEKEENKARGELDVEDSVSIERTQLINSHFDKVIKKNFQKRFLEFGGKDLNEQQRIEAIFVEIKRLIFNDILNQNDMFESKKIKEWLLANRDALLNQNHKQHQEAMTQSRNYLNNTNNYRHAAWRNFDAGAPKDGTWPNLFVGAQAGSRDHCRLMLAYYYLVVTDNTQTQEQISNGLNNLISELGVIRRAHRTPNNEDSPSCYSGTLGRLVEMGKYHPVAVFPLHYTEFLSEIMRDKLKIKLKEAFSECKSFHEKTILLEALKTFEDGDGLNKIATNQLNFSRSLLDIRYEFISRFSSTSKLMEEINKELTVRKVVKKLDDKVANQKNKVNSMLYSVWKFARKDIEANFMESLTPEELANYIKENGTVPAGTLKEPYADTILKQSLEGIVGEKYINTAIKIFMISKLIWECLANRLDAKQREELSNEMGHALKGLKEDKEMRKVIDDLVGTKLTGSDAEAIANMIFDRIKVADFSENALTLIRMKTLGSAVSARVGFGNTAASAQPVATASSLGDVKSAVDRPAVSAISMNVDLIRQQADNATIQHRKYNIIHLVSNCLTDKLDVKQQNCSQKRLDMS